MAQILGKDQATYAKERDVFLRDLQHFHDIRGTPFKRAPTLGGKEVDLYLLYTLVTSQGGWLRANSKNTWPEILPLLKLPSSCVNGSVALKQIYLRYLDRWEKVHFLHEDADRASDDDEESRHKRWSARSLHSVPTSYNYNQHNVTDASREFNHMSTNLYKPSDYERLSLSLLSPLPNEQDFAINVCTLLSNDGKHTLKLEKHPKLINYLLGHAGVFSNSSLRQLFTHFYNIIRRRPIVSFWREVLESPEFLDLTNETKFKSSLDTETSTKSAPLIIGKEEEPALVALNRANLEVSEITNKIDSPDCEIIEDYCDSFKLKLNPEDTELFSVKRGLGTQDYVGQRVLQIATILRNLSFIEENVPVLVKNTSFIRFLLLCSISRWNILRNLGNDMLSNIASEFIVRDFQNDLLACNLIRIVTKGLDSEDRAECLSSLEVLNKLSQNEQNEDIIQKSLQAHVYKSVCSFLTLHDVMLLIYTLECLYSLSSLGERSCNFIIVNHGVIDTLVALVTVEGKSYGPKACIGMKLVETLPSGGSQQAQVTNAAPSQTSSPQQQSVSVTNTISTLTAISSSSLTATNSSSITAITSGNSTLISNSSTATKVNNIPNTPTRPISITPQRLLPLSPSPATTTSSTTSVIQSSSSMTPQQMIQQQHAHQQAIHENEQFALAWLRATYEPCTNGKVDHQELYKYYLNSCSTIGRRGVISPLHFPRCVRSIFGGTVGPNPVKPSNASDPQYYEGIKVRDKPLIINLPPSSIPKPNVSCSSPTVPVNNKTPQVRRKSVQPVLVSTATGTATATAKSLTVVADNNGLTDGISPASPASPILKAQLSAPPKQRDGAPSPVSSKGDMKSQAMAHPHLSQALLGSTASTTVPCSSTVTVTTASSKESQAATGQTSNTSLIKSLLATKVNDCMSMRTATDCQNVAQVAARQQRLLAQQGQQSSESLNKIGTKDTLKTNQRLNGVRQLFTDNEIGDPSVSSTTQFTDLTKGKKEPPQPPPPPLAPLSNNIKGGKQQRIDNEDSDSIGNHSVASSSGLGTIGIGGVSSTEDGENSLTSFEGLLNGIPTIENALNEDSDSKDYVKIGSSEISVNKPLRLADLLEKKFEKSPPLLNGTLGKELRLGEKAMDLVENHIEKALSREIANSSEKCIKMEVEKHEILDIKQESLDIEVVSLKRTSTDEIFDIEAKRPLLSTNINGSSLVDSPAPDSSSSNGDDGPSTVSTAAAKLFADIAADILEDEDEEQLLQEAQSANTAIVADGQGQVQLQQQNSLQQIIVDQNNQQVLLTQPRQIIVSQPQLATTSQVVISGTTMKTQTGQTVIVQNSSGQRPMMLAQQNAAGQIVLSQGLQGQMQIVASSQPGQYVLQTSSATGQGAAYVVAQPQTAMVHGTQPQTVLLAQTQQQQGTGTKTIIILQQQPTAGSPTQHQKVMVTPQGQQVVVTQVARPVVHTSSVSNNVSPTTKVIKSVSNNSSSSTTQNTNNPVTEKKEEIKKQRPRDLTTPYTCEWGDCMTTKTFKSANEVYLHACEEHCPTGSEETICQWDRCDNMKRKRFSLMTHLHDKHCNTEVMKQSLMKRKQAAQTTKTETSTPPSTSPHPGYAPDAALHAIKRHALEFVNPKELQDDNEGPVTKSIRLTASLILRNLVIYSSQCKRYLKSYESHLANVALSNVESSRTIAQILFDMNDGSTHR